MNHYACLNRGFSRMTRMTRIFPIFMCQFQRSVLLIRSDEWIDTPSPPNSSDQFWRESPQRRVDNSADWFQPLGVFQSVFENV